ncbi:sensor histidine kinase [Polaribacter sp. IC066]|nr:sensor histidine kinase [Polaribacter sp. IC063]TXD56223.1 sensor histidine kinase [Polaribacter sp. IC066]
MISILNLQLQKISNDQFKATFQYSINRVTTIARVHDKLLKSKNLNKIAVHDYIVNIIDDLKIIYTSLYAIDMQINVDKNICMDMDQTQALGLIINELITNSNKYAFTKEANNIINLTIKNKEDLICFEYSDNGVGFNMDTVNKKDFIGITLIQRLANQLGTQATITSKTGMHISFSFKSKLKV